MTRLHFPVDLTGVKPWQRANKKKITVAVTASLVIVDGNDGSKRLWIEREESGLYRKRVQCGQIGQVLLRAFTAVVLNSYIAIF